MTFIFRNFNKENEQDIQECGAKAGLWNKRPVPYRPRVPLQQISINVQQSFNFEKPIEQKQNKALEILEDRDPQNCAEYAGQIYDHLYSVESKYLPNPNYFDTIQRNHITNEMRTKLVDWLSQVHNRYRLRDETLFLCVNILDRFLSQKAVSRSKLQLVGITAMMIASKYEDIYCPSTKNYVDICANTYSTDELLRMEILILSTLRFNVTIASPLAFIEKYLKNANSKTRNIAMYLAYTSILDAGMLKYKPSVIAATCVRIARLMCPCDDISRYPYSADQLKQCGKDLLDLVLRHQKSNIFIYKKYCSRRTLEVGKLVPLMIPRIEL